MSKKPKNPVEHPGDENDRQLTAGERNELRTQLKEFLSLIAEAEKVNGLVDNILIDHDIPPRISAKLKAAKTWAIGIGKQYYENFNF